MPWAAASNVTLFLLPRPAAVGSFVDRVEALGSGPVSPPSSCVIWGTQNTLWAYFHISNTGQNLLWKQGSVQCGCLSVGVGTQRATLNLTCSGEASMVAPRSQRAKLTTQDIQKFLTKSQSHPTPDQGQS